MSDDTANIDMSPLGILVMGLISTGVLLVAMNSMFESEALRTTLDGVILLFVACVLALGWLFALGIL